VDPAGARGCKGICDALAPNYPVLIGLAVGGPRHGQVILDPEGNRIVCDRATFLWHEYDQNGNVTTLNEVFEYRLGTLTTYVGAQWELRRRRMSGGRVRTPRRETLR
jgi:hypothetical protein